MGVDLGGTNTKVGLVDDQGYALSASSFSTESQKGPEDAVRRMGAAVRELVEKTGLELDRVVRVGLGSPGTMDLETGMLLDPPNLPGWGEFAIRDKLKDLTGRPVSFVNDGTAAAYGEYWIGGGREYKSMVLFTLGTGIGCGIIVNDMPIHGEHSHGSECGHLIINFHEDARICGCGHSGHLEAYASAIAIVKRIQEDLARGRETTISRRISAGEELSPKMLAEEAENGDAYSLEIVDQTAVYIGVGIVNLMHTIDPNCVLLGGAMNFGGKESSLGRDFLKRVQEEVNHRAFPVLAEKTTIDFASLGGDAGYIGAAGVARLDYWREAADR